MNKAFPSLSINGTKFLQLGSEFPTVWMPEKAIYPTSPICSARKPRGVLVLEMLQSLHDSDSNGVDAKNVANISLVSNDEVSVPMD